MKPTMKATIVVHNAPEYAKQYKYIVATIVAGTAWFYGAWNKLEYAQQAAEELDGRVILEQADVD